MRPRLLPLALFLPLAACSAASPRSAKPEPAPAARFTYHAALASVPAGASEVRLGVRVPEHEATGELRALSAFGLVGNAPFEFVLPDSESGTLEQEHVRVSWQRVGAKEQARREIVLATHGKALEFGLRLALAAPAGTSADARALEAELAAETWGEIDARPAPAVATRCERVR